MFQLVLHLFDVKNQNDYTSRVFHNDRSPVFPITNINAKKEKERRKSHTKEE